MEMLDSQANPDHSGEGLTTEGYDQYVAKLNEVIDGVNLLRMSILVALGGKDKDFKPVVRPKTEVQKQLDKRMYEVDEKNTKETMAEFGF